MTPTARGTRRGLRLLFGASLLLSACGTTAKLSAQSDLGGNAGAGAGLGANRTASSPNATTQTSAGTSGSGPSAGGSSSGATTGGTVPSQPSAGGGPSGAAAGTGPAGGGPSGKTEASASGARSAGPIKIGITYIKDEGTVYSSLGAKAPADNPQVLQAEVQAIFKYLNAHGGFDGRPVEPVFYGYNVTGNGGNFSEIMQAECAYFTQDNPVFAVDSFNEDVFPPLPQCLAQHHTMLIDAGNSIAEERSQTQPLQPYYLRPFTLDMSRLAIQPEELIAHGFLHPTDKIGILRFDDQQGADADSIVRSVLAQHGMKVASDYAFTPLTSLDAVASVAQESSNAVLSFRAAGVDKIIPIATQAVTYFFGDDAQTQGYFPGYGMSSLDLPAYVVANVPAQQAQNIVDIGWNRVADEDYETTSATDQALPQAKQCLSIERGAGVSPGDPFACDTFFLLQAAIGESHQVSAAGVARGLSMLGTSFTAAQALGTHWLDGHDDGAAVGRVATFNSTCSCMQYTGGTFPLP